jgi:hypothetical protein
MADRPILFSAPMVRALLDGRKTQTRRTLKLPKWSTENPEHVEPDDDGTPMIICKDTGCLASIPIRFAEGDRLWVREAFRFDPGGTVSDAAGGQMDYVEPHYVYRDDAKPGGWKPGIHMPRAASRLTLTVTDVRVERLQEISEIDAMAEGIIRHDPTETEDAEFLTEEGGDIYSSAVDAYEALWNRINGALAWRENPWVVAVSFSVERRNIDSKPMPYLIWSNVHGAWWGPDRAGYYTELASAGRYTREEAIAQCANGRDGFTARRTPPELPVREIDALTRNGRSIDKLVLKEDRAECRRRDMSRKART